MSKGNVRKLLIWIVLLNSSCFDSGPEEGPVNLINLEILPSYTTDTRDNWIIVSNELGELIASTPFESGQLVELIGEGGRVGSKVTVTLASYVNAQYSASARDFYFFNSYTDIPIGSAWYLKRAAPLPDESAGTVSVTLTNLPAPDYYLSVSSTNRRNNLVGNWGSETANVQVGLRKSPSDLFFSITGSNPRYVKIEEALSGEDYSFDFVTGFAPFDNVHPISFAPLTFFGFIHGFTIPMDQALTTSSYYHEQTFYNGTPSNLQMACNQGYSFYLTNWSAQMPNGDRIGYYKIGDAPEAQSFVPVSGNFTMQNTGLNSTRFEASANFVYCLNEWISVDDITQGLPIVNWQVARPIGSQTPVLTLLPADLMSQHPYIMAVFDRIEYRRSNFVSNISGTTYDIFINEQLGTDSFTVQSREWASLGR